MDITPILNGPPGFVILALSFAVAAYLRQVSATASELSDKIRGGQVWNYPIGPPVPTHTMMKLESLERTHAVLNKTAPFLVWLVIVASLRVVTYSLLVLPVHHWMLESLKHSLPFVDL